MLPINSKSSIKHYDHLNVRSDCLIYSDTVAHNTSYFLISFQVIFIELQTYNIANYVSAQNYNRFIYLKIVNKYSDYLRLCPVPVTFTIFTVQLFKDTM